MKRCVTMLLVLMLAAFVPCVMFAQELRVDVKTLAINPANDITWPDVPEIDDLQGLSFSNHEMILEVKIPVYVKSASRLSLTALARIAQNDLEGPPPAGFAGISYSPLPGIAIDAGIGLAARSGVLNEEILFLGKKFRQRFALQIKKPLFKERDVSIALSAEMEMGGQGLYEWKTREDWWDRENTRWTRAHCMLDFGLVGAGFLYESNVGPGMRIDAPIPGGLNLYGGLLWSEKKTFEGEEIIPAGTRVWVMGGSFALTGR